MTKNFKLSILFFIAGSLAFTGFFYLSTFLRARNEAKIIPPYYNAKDLVKPTDIPEVLGSTSAKLKIPIIMYHYIEYVKDQGDLIRKRLDIVPKVFNNELKSLSEHGYQTYFVKDVPDILNGKIKYDPTKSVILTFDDGYEDFYTDAFPLLKKYNMKATIYLVYDFIGRRGFLNEDEIREIIASGLVEVGSHTLDHVYLKSASKKEAEKQITESKRKLEDKFWIRVKTFAYPYGAFNNDVMSIVKDTSYSAAVSVIPGSIQSEENLFYLSRIRAGSFSYNITNVLQALKK